MKTTLYVLSATCFVGSLFLAGCSTLFDGKLDCPIGTSLCKRAKVQYEACPTCAWDRVQGAVTAIGYAKDFICAYRTTPAGALACIPTSSEVDDLLAMIKTRVENGGGGVSELGLIAVEAYAMAGDDERAAAMAAVLNPDE